MSKGFVEKNKLFFMFLIYLLGRLTIYLLQISSNIRNIIKRSPWEASHRKVHLEILPFKIKQMGISNERDFHLYPKVKLRAVLFPGTY